MLTTLARFVRDSDSRLLKIVRGVALPVLRLVKTVLLWIEEMVLNIRTSVPERSVPAKSDGLLFADNREYASINFWHTRRMLRVVEPGPDDVVFDLGAGAGRMVCVAARLDIRKCIGVEISEKYCDRARQNARRLRGRKAPIEIVCEDATRTDLSAGTIFYMFNPFGRDTLAAVVENLHQSLRVHPRRVRIIYVNPVHDELLHACSWLIKFDEFHALTGWRVSFWRNRAEEGVQ